jgi:transcriptional regulator with XRE-family HTH domain
MLAAVTDYRRLRAVLAYHRISQRQFAKACGLSPVHVCRILSGGHPGELALLKITSGLTKLGLDGEVAHAK